MNIEVDISITLSSTQCIKVSENFDRNNIELLKEETIKQINIPINNSLWVIDDFCVC